MMHAVFNKSLHGGNSALSTTCKQPSTLLGYFAGPVTPEKKEVK
jgi:hypothetical protein